MDICTYIHTYIWTYVHTYIHTYIWTYVHTYIHTYIWTYGHMYIHTYMHACTLSVHIYDLSIHLQNYIHTQRNTHVFSWEETEVRQRARQREGVREREREMAPLSAPTTHFLFRKHTRIPSISHPLQLQNLFSPCSCCWKPYLLIIIIIIIFRKEKTSSKNGSSTRRWWWQWRWWW